MTVASHPEGAVMGGLAEKGGGSFHGLELLLSESPLPPIDEAIAAAQAEVPKSNFCTETSRSAS